MKKTLITIVAFLAIVGPAISSAQVVNFGQTTYKPNPLVQINPYVGVNRQSGVSYGGSGTNCGSNSLTLCSVINTVIGYLNQALFLLIGLSVVVFVYYIFHYFIKADTDKKEAGLYVLYSVIGFFVILSMWGLVNILQNTFGLGNSGFAHSSWDNIANIFPR